MPQRGDANDNAAADDGVGSGMKSAVTPAT